MKLENVLDIESCLDLTPVEVEVIGELTSREASLYYSFKRPF